MGGSSRRHAQAGVILIHHATRPRTSRSRRVSPDGGQWPQAISDRVTGWLVLRLCQMAAVTASSRWAMRGSDPGDGAAAVQFEIKLPLEGAAPDVGDELDARGRAR